MSFLIQWESGRTRQNLLHSVRESKADHISVREPVPQDAYSPNSAYVSLPMLPHSGQSSQRFLDHNHGGAQFLPTVEKRLNLKITPSREHCAKSPLQVRRCPLGSPQRTNFATVNSQTSRRVGSRQNLTKKPLTLE